MSFLLTCALLLLLSLSADVRSTDDVTASEGNDLSKANMTEAAVSNDTYSTSKVSAFLLLEVTISKSYTPMLCRIPEIETTSRTVYPPPPCSPLLPVFQAIAWCSKNTQCTGFTAQTPTGCAGAHAGVILDVYFKTGGAGGNTDKLWSSWTKPTGDKAVDSNGFHTEESCTQVRNDAHQSTNLEHARVH